MSLVPQHQHYRNIFLQGCYYVGAGTPLSGLMSKRAAKRFRRKLAGNSGGMYNYGVVILKCPNTPKSRWKIFLTNLKKTG